LETKDHTGWLSYSKENAGKTFDTLGQHHYTSRIIDSDKNVWFHDGMITGNGSQSQGTVTNIKSKDLNKCNQKSVALLVYAQK